MYPWCNCIDFPLLPSIVYQRHKLIEALVRQFRGTSGGGDAEGGWVMNDLHFVNVKNACMVCSPPARHDQGKKKKCYSMASLHTHTHTHTHPFSLSFPLSPSLSLPPPLSSPLSPPANRGALSVNKKGFILIHTRLHSHPQNDTLLDYRLI